MLAEYFGGISGRVIYSLVTAFLAAFVLTPYTIARLKKRQFGQVIREEGVEAHKKKAGVPTMGGIVMLVAVVVATGSPAAAQTESTLTGTVVDADSGQPIPGAVVSLGDDATWI